MVRAKEQLKSAMMMNLESKAIVFEDIGRLMLILIPHSITVHSCSKMQASAGTRQKVHSHGALRENR